MPEAPAPRVLVVDADPSLRELLEEWLAAHGCRIARAPAQGAVDLIVADVPFPRESGLDAVRRVSGEHPRAPLVLLSSNFFPGIEPGGALARSLGAAAVLAKPVTREALLAAVGMALERAA
jgi:CheY-like chemotaxis protein